VAGIHARLTLVHIPRAGTWTGGCRIGIRPRPSLIANAHKAGGIGRLDACAMIATKLPGSAGQAGVVPEATVSAGESIAANAPEMRSRRNTCHLLSLPQGDALFHLPIASGCVYALAIIQAAGQVRSCQSEALVHVILACDALN